LDEMLSVRVTDVFDAHVMGCVAFVKTAGSVLGVGHIWFH
jgi:hypothetical protein